VPFIDLAVSPLAAGLSPVRIHYREVGAGRPLVFLHSGWGYEIYPFDRQIPVFAPHHRIISPDRSGYGRSTPIDSLPSDFHLRAAAETRALIDELGLEQPVVWGHSDGAIIALLLALASPTLVTGVIAEATHFYRRKPRSRAFFESMIGEQRALGESVAKVLARDHGERWPDVIERHSRAWQQIAEEAASDADDFYGGRLGEIAVPVLVVHGARDPRTEPGEIEAVRHALVRADRRVGPGRTHGSAPTDVVVLPSGGHSPHSEPAAADDVGRIARGFIDSIRA
jgi:pimeloyl-ACP methyl ester carboxylesterase